MSLPRALAGTAVALLIASSSVIAISSTAHADVPAPSLELPFNAPLCAGTTDFDPAVNPGMAVEDTTLVFGERLQSYNAGLVVPLYDSFGGTILIDGEGVVGPNAAYPPICGTRYDATVGGAVSEWMFCTDISSDSCGDTDAEGRIVDSNGTPVNPMTDLDVNPKLSVEQEKLISYLVQNGHSYAGIGNQAWGGVSVAQSGGNTNERNALQTLVWCISDPALPGSSDFAATCEANLPADEQQRLLSLIPDIPELELAFANTEAVLEVGGSASFALTTNVYNHPIALELSGTAGPEWSVCAGDAVLDGQTLTVAGTDPSQSTTVTICATGQQTGTAEILATATPPSTQHVSWAQSQNNPTADPCQVFATFREVQKVQVTSSASASFTVKTDVPEEEPEVPGEPTEPEAPTNNGEVVTMEKASDQSPKALANTGSTPLDGAVWLGLLTIALGGVLLAANRRRRFAQNS
jgi:LPXTG-motif cell wall-anchored protein